MNIKRLVKVITRRRESEAVAEAMILKQIKATAAYVSLDTFKASYPHLQLDIQDISRLN